MPLKRGIRAGYGAAELGLAGGELLLQLYLLEFYVRGVGLSPLLAGIALGLAIFWDAVTDPLMGGLLDRTRTRWGRFVPYLAAGGLLFALGLAAVFNPPSGLGQASLFAYLLFTYIIVNTGLTIIGIPHIALGGVLTPDTHERTELYGWRLVFGTLGLFAGILSPLLAAEWLGLPVDTREGLVRSRAFGSMLMGAVVVVTAALTIAVVWRRSRALPAPSGTFRWQDLWSNLGAVLRNPVFRPFFLAFILAAMGRTLNATLALPYYKDSLALSESRVQGPILSVFTLVIIVSVPAWTWLGRRFGKKMPAFFGMAFLGLMTLVAYPLFPPGGLAGPVAAAVLGGFAVGAIILLESLLTDIADEDYVRNGEEREGLYFGFWRMGQKVARSITLGLTGLMLSSIGYDETLAVQTEETRRSLAWLFGGGVGAFFLLASFTFLFTPMDLKQQETVQSRKAERLKREKEA